MESHWDSRRDVRGALRVGISAFLVGTVISGAAIAQSSPPLIGPGHPSIDSSTLHRFSASWRESALQGSEWRDRSTVAESLSTGRRGAVHVFHRDATPVGWEGYTLEAVFDRVGFRPRSLERRFKDGIAPAVLKQLEAGGLPQSYRFEFGELRYVLTRTGFDGTISVDTATFDRPMFDGTTLGLLLASLPLRVGFTARLPILFVQPDVGSVTKYWAIVRVAAIEPVPGPNATSVDTYRVDVDWADYDTGVVSSPGGPENSGGSYWIARQPPGGFPFVPRYASSSVDYLLQLTKRGDMR
jgi:hypothetical protein